MKLSIGVQSPGSSFIARIIAGYDIPRRFSHAALFVDDQYRIEAHIDSGVARVDGATDDRWTMFPLELEPWAIALIYDFIIGEIGAGYDTDGVFAVAHLPFCREDPARWFCSELVVAACQKGGMFEGVRACEVTPNKLYRLCRGEA